MGRQMVMASLVLGLLVVFAQPVQSQKIALGNSIRATPPHFLPIMAGQENGFFKAEGLEIEWIPFKSGGDFSAAMAAGHLKVGSSSGVLAIMMAVRGLPVKVVAEVQDKYYNWAVWVSADSPLKKPEDLKGGTAGTTRFGAISHAFGVAVFKTLGLEKDVKIVALGGSAEQMAALRAGSVKSNIQSHQAMAELKVQGKVRELIRMEDYLPQVRLDAVLTARKDFVQQEAGLLKRLVRAYLKGMGWAQANKDWSLARMQTEGKLSEPAARLVWEAVNFSRDGKVGREKMRNLINFLVEYKILPKDKAPSVEELITEEFA